MHKQCGGGHLHDGEARLQQPEGAQGACGRVVAEGAVQHAVNLPGHHVHAELLAEDLAELALRQ